MEESKTCQTSHFSELLVVTARRQGLFFCLLSTYSYLSSPQVFLINSLFSVPVHRLGTRKRWLFKPEDDRRRCGRLFLHLPHKPLRSDVCRTRAQSLLLLLYTGRILQTAYTRNLAPLMIPMYSIHRSCKQSTASKK